MWLEASVTNNDPNVIAEYYCDCIKQVSGVPRIVHAEWNGIDSFSGDTSFMYGRSVSNQRIEAWSSFLRKTESDW